jgi:hypothetical protein
MRPGALPRHDRARIRSTARHQSGVAERKAQPVEGLVPVSRSERRLPCKVASNAKADFNRAALEPSMEGHGIVGASTFVEQTGSQVGYTRLSGDLDPRPLHANSTAIMEQNCARLDASGTDHLLTVIALAGSRKRDHPGMRGEAVA